MEKVYEIVLDGEQLNDYMRGRISGIIYMLVRKPNRSFAWSSKEYEDRWTIKTQCSEGIYNEIIKTIEHVYPGVLIEE